MTGARVDCTQVQAAGIGGPSTATPAIKFVGRYDMSDPTRARFDWSGNYATARFDGTEVSVGINLPENRDMELVFEAAIDDRDPIKFVVTPDRTSYLVANDLAPGTHEITVMRNSEAFSGSSEFTGFNFGASGKLLAPTERPRRIEFIGDSITCGYGNEGPNATCPYDVEVRPNVKVAMTENIYLAYGSIAARALSADAVTTCFFGKGVVLNFRENEHDDDAKTTIPQYYERTLANVREGNWDFTKEPEPQAVVINLGTNDFSRDVDKDGVADGIDLGAFKAGYANFVAYVRERRPNAHIFLAVPPMLTDKFPLDNARSNMRDVLGQIVSDRAAAGDTMVYRIDLVEMGTRYGLGCDYHPNLEVHRIMADQVIGAIREKTCW
ncbi:Endoglucanase E precursor [Labilithrix luteola]|uniref:Endoglucanase E n=1 Tax=Labilithrix luteola TaxID=1391654 RepID=A0A0K1PYN6_9BACT|nr:Endoglucanase E precursor [Labilithrix luteola]